MISEICISLSRTGFVLNLLGIIVTVFSLDEPVGPTQDSDPLKRLLSYIRRPRLFAVGMTMTGLGIVTLIAGHYFGSDCFSLREMLLTNARITRPLCYLLRPLMLEIPELSLYRTVWAITILLAALLFLVALVRGAGRLGRIHGAFRIVIGGILGPPLLAALIFFGSRLYVTAFPKNIASPQTDASPPFRLQAYEGDGNLLDVALKQAIPVGTPKTYVDALLAETTRSVRKETVIYLYRTKSLMTCLFSSVPPPVAWSIEVSYSPQSTLKAMIVRPMQEAVSP
jgi:hypothetical protein